MTPHFSMTDPTDYSAVQRVVRRMLSDARTLATPHDPTVIDYWTRELLVAVKNNPQQTEGVADALAADRPDRD